MQTSTRSTRSKMALLATHEQEQQRRLMADIGPSIRAGAVAKRLGISVPMVEQLRLSNRILAIPDTHGYVYPCWQFEARSMLSGIMPVLRTFAGYDAWTQLAFMVSPNPHLANQRPLDTLRHGEVEAVLMAARCFVDDRPSTTS